MTDQKAHLASLSRADLLAAVDAEIRHAETDMSSSGLNTWALTLSLSGLVWLAIELSGRRDIDWRDTMLLAVSMTVLWQFATDVLGSTDTSLHPAKRKRGKFFSLSWILGALRSTILFAVLKIAALALAIRWLDRPELRPLAVYVNISLFFSLLAFLFSFVPIPPLPIFDIHRRSPISNKSSRLTTCLTVVLRIEAVIALFVTISCWDTKFSDDSIRLSVVIAACLYLLTLLVDKRFPTAHLSALRDVRQNFAFERMPIEEAHKNLDALLFAGGTAASTMHDSPDALLNKANEIRALYNEAAPLMTEFHKIEIELKEKQADLLTKAREEERQRIKVYLQQLHQDAEEEHKGLSKRLKRLEAHIKVIAFFSAKSARELEPLVGKIKTAVEPLEQRRCELARALA